MSKPKAAKAETEQQSKIGKMADKTAIGVLKVLQSPYEGTVGQWMAHGATELANMALHGHAAPVYSHSLAPSDVAPTADTPAEAPVAVTPTTGYEQTNTAQPKGIVDKYLPNAGPAQESQPSQAMVTSHGPDAPPAEGIVDQYMQQLQASPTLREPEQELSK